MLKDFTKSFQGINKEVWILSAAMLINRVGSVVMAFLSLYLTKELGYSMSKAGIVMAAYGVGSIMGSYLGGWLVDRKDYFNILVYSLVISGLVLLPMFFLNNYYFIISNVFIYALIADIFRPVNSVAIKYYSTEENRTRSVSLIRLAVNLGFGIGPMIGGIVATTIGFRYIFLMDAITSIAAGVYILLYLPRIKSAIEGVKKEKPSKSSSVFYDKSFIVFLLLVTIYGSLFFQLFASVPIYFSQDFHYSEDLIGYLLGLNGLLVVALEMFIIYKIQNKYNASFWIGIGCTMMVIAYALLALNINSIALCIVYTLFITLSEIFAMPFMMTYALARPEAERQGQYMAMYSVAYGISYIVAPAIGLTFAETYNFPMFYAVASAASIGLGFLFYYMMKD